jgi:ribosomal protein L40E
MDDLTSLFPGCTLTTGEIREVIEKILCDDYICHKCFRRVDPYATKCLVCYRLYCEKCAISLTDGESINPNKCIQCIDNQNFLEEHCL